MYASFIEDACNTKKELLSSINTYTHTDKSEDALE